MYFSLPNISVKSILNINYMDNWKIKPRTILIQGPAKWEIQM